MSFIFYILGTAAGLLAIVRVEAGDRGGAVWPLVACLCFLCTAELTRRGAYRKGGRS